METDRRRKAKEKKRGRRDCLVPLIYADICTSSLTDTLETRSMDPLRLITELSTRANAARMRDCCTAFVFLSLR